MFLVIPVGHNTKILFFKDIINFCSFCNRLAKSVMGGKLSFPGLSANPNDGDGTQEENEEQCDGESDVSKSCSLLRGDPVGSKCADDCSSSIR